MKKSSIKWIILLITIGISTIYGIWWLLQPVEISAVHRGSGKGSSTVLVRHFPLTDSGKIAWWEKNKQSLKTNYGIPYTDDDGSFMVYFLYWDGTYRIDRGTDQDSDLLCFSDMNAEANCIEKKGIALSVSRNREGKMRFTTNGNSYVKFKGSEEIKRVMQ
ncbi:DUF943 family protein [Xenorhabdus bovienii]|uniref:Uncharacterized protein n=1 Tax=Xenorhabdus bovienii str. kraussei Quebec TaxID=1398203 RepID=A0A077P458_XENBV|nr:DUF943 family protein [Xenorhabdus bovienii]MDE9445996.1 DUF943 family protein [Xenorhabdus bovienii]MDE9453413.1 DUF943 family protein [Xenorhabdus bovienii]MDE9458562.1 DUF943 family protein [Xenorhabdus bovienii]MDE9462209.1 DUF943 family protein [Xenorhabdus bovienii]MDE9465790.1 DUF943 family protein [Xenorhabdus bovienii]